MKLMNVFDSIIINYYTDTQELLQQWKSSKGIVTFLR